MRRRDFIAVVGGIAIARPIGPLAQQSAKGHRLAVVVPLNPTADLTTAGSSPFWRLVFQEFERLGYVEGQNLVVERYSAEGRTERYGELVDSAIRSKPDVILVLTGRLTEAFKRATVTIPIVAMTNDPIALGLVTSLAHPGSNITGVVSDAGIEIWEKHLEFLKEVVPTAARVALLMPRILWEGSMVPKLKSSILELAQKRGISLIGALVDGPLGPAEYGQAFEMMKQQRVDAMVVFDATENFFNRKTIVTLATKEQLPAIYPYRAHAQLGGLMAYAFDQSELGRHAVSQVDQILRGTNPGDIPFHQPTRFQLTINLKTAKALGLTVPPSLLARADEVIE
jgi:putative ABC transport system substrate-binding protein